MSSDQPQQGHNNDSSSNDNDDELQRLQEQNFDLQATIAALQAEKNFEVSALQRSAASTESKLRAELRLAQQDAQRWRSLAQGNRPKSIISSHKNSISPAAAGTPSVGASLRTRVAPLASTAMASAPAMARTPTDDDVPMTVGDAAGKSSNGRLDARNDGNADTDDDTNSNVLPDFSGHLQSPPTRRRRVNEDRHRKPSARSRAANPSEQPPNAAPSLSPVPTFYPTSHLASNLLTHTTQETSETATASSSPSMVQEDSHIRQILIGIACRSASRAAVTTSLERAEVWTEEELVEWLIQQSALKLQRHEADQNESSSQMDDTNTKDDVEVDSPVEPKDTDTMTTESTDAYAAEADADAAPKKTSGTPIVSTAVSAADKYWGLALTVSPAARQHVVRRVLVEASEGPKPVVDDSQMDIDEENNDRKEASSLPRRRGQHARIQPLGINREDEDLFYARLDTARKALRNPFWDPNTPIPYPPNSPATNSTVSPLTFDLRQFIRFLASSCYTPHLRILMLIIEEANAVDGDATTVWWDLCYDAVVKTIQRLIYQKVLPPALLKEPDKQKTNNRGRSGGTRRPSSRGSSADASRRKTRDRRRRIKNMRMRLKTLNVVAPKDESTQSENDNVLEHALLVVLALLRNTPAEKIDQWYDDMTGLEPKEDSSPPGGLALVSLLLDLLDYLLFVEWKKESSPLHPKHVLTTGSFNVQNNNARPQRKPAATAIPRYYLAVITILQQVGRRWNGMKVLRTRVKDDRENDRMGNALDVSIRHLQSLAWHWENHKVLEGAIVDLDDETRPKCDHCKRTRSVLVDAVESWIRLWHQVLLFVQQCQAQDISFRSLVIELQDHYTSACAMLLSSEDTRKEIKTMLRWHLEELAFDEEEYLEAEEERKKERSNKG